LLLEAFLLLAFFTLAFNCSVFKDLWACLPPLPAQAAFVYYHILSPHVNHFFGDFDKKFSFPRFCHKKGKGKRPN
jgi:hypothetical protein